MSWKDRGHPLAGGAESVSGNIIDHLLNEGHSVKLITAAYPSAASNESRGNLETIRQGSRYSVYPKAKQYYKQHLQSWADIVIDEMNTIPFIAPLYTKKPTLLLCYQLAREVWLHQMIPPISYVGYLSEPFMLRFMANKYTAVATESNSTKRDMEQYGFKNVQTFRVGMHLTPLPKLVSKENKNLVLSLGSIRPMKRTLHALKAFELARDKNSDLHMVIAGDDSGKYAARVKAHAQQSRHSSAIEITGRVSSQERVNLMKQAGIILVTSVKEGWGLIVTEANSQGTPAIVYDVDGLRDSVQNGKTGIVVPNNDTNAMSAAIVSILASQQYETYRLNAWTWSAEFTLDQSYKDFLAIMQNTLKIK